MSALLALIFTCVKNARKEKSAVAQAVNRTKKFHVKRFWPVEVVFGQKPFYAPISAVTCAAAEQARPSRSTTE